MAIPTEIPRTKRHYAVYLLCLLKVRNTLADQRLCVWAGLLELFQVSALRMIERLKRKRWATSWRDARDEIGAGLGSARGFAVVRVDGGGVEGAC